MRPKKRQMLILPPMPARRTIAQKCDERSNALKIFTLGKP
ncbi:hypothetical protein HMPREF9120_02567 [Neisseria sp. oral taxon 020 str. F0370]|nr:hypothetical protein HMPREF9120_02567 [Neisseria sp. oral taxon 020 str. F0370]